VRITEPSLDPVVSVRCECTRKLMAVVHEGIICLFFQNRPAKNTVLLFLLLGCLLLSSSGVKDDFESTADGPQVHHDQLALHRYFQAILIAIMQVPNYRAYVQLTCTLRRLKDLTRFL
jgi:hypothetical protein